MSLACITKYNLIDLSLMQPEVNYVARVLFDLLELVAGGNPPESRTLESALYERLGFTQIEGRGMYWFLERS